MKRHFLWKVLILLVIFSIPSAISAKEKSVGVKIPSSVFSIEKENTVANPSSELMRLEPSDFTKNLINASKVPVENPELIRLLNESAASQSPLSFGTRATIFLGEWPINYKSEQTEPNWQYQKINTNFFDNRGGQSPYQFHYVQEGQKVIKGGLTAKVEHADEVKKMMQQAAYQKVKLPLAFETTIGAGTKHHQAYNIPQNKMGYLYAYAPAIHEKGKLTFGEVYIVLRGSKQKIVVKNVASQEIGAWIPVQDSVSFSYEAKD